MHNSKLQISILGASGYVGVELIRILKNHPKVEIAQLIANSEAGKEIYKIHSHLSRDNLPKMITLNQAKFDEIDLIFSCLPHGLSQEIIADIIAKYPKKNIIDLSADFRFSDVQEYEKHYQATHKAKKIQEKFIYGLSEFYHHKISQSKYIACPGCYPTSILLPILPLVKLEAIDVNNIIIDAKSGVSGAGRSLKYNNLYCEINENLKPYSIAKHRHLGEITKEIRQLSTQKFDESSVIFTPHLVPLTRGMLSTIYVNLSDGFKIDDLKNILETKFIDEYFIEISSDIPAIKDVAMTNFCKIGVFASSNKNKAIIVSAIDNLTKGSSGQAVQNMNLIYGFDEREGLKLGI
jgi:N-acetyl-gamma-glutamyl-phosphate reductase